MNKLNLTEKEPLTNQEKEVYRTLRTNIEFTGVENQVLAVTSCMPDDGKTMVSFQLASAFAEEGKKTLYIDADLRKSIFMRRYSIEGNPKGLSHYLSGQIHLQDVLYATNRENLFLIPVGRFPSNPTELFSKERFHLMLEQLKEEYDYVIIDTPPLGSVIDAAVIAKKCDASMLVIAADKTSRSFVRNVIGQLKAANPNFLGVVLNKIDIKRGGYYYGRRYGGYYGGKYRSYGSYYGEAEKTGKKA